MFNKTRIALLIASCAYITAASAAVPHTFEAGTRAKASEVNENFAAVDATANNAYVAATSAHAAANDATTAIINLSIQVDNLKQSVPQMVTLASLNEAEGVVKHRKGLNPDQCDNSSECPITYITESVEGSVEYLKRIYIYNPSETWAWRRTEYWNGATGLLERIEAGPVDGELMVKETVTWTQGAPSEVAVGSAWYQVGQVERLQDYDQDGTFEPNTYETNNEISELVRLAAITSFKLPNGEIQTGCAVFENNGTDVFGGYSEGIAIRCPGLGEVYYRNKTWLSTLEPMSSEPIAPANAAPTPQGMQPTPRGLVKIK